MPANRLAGSPLSRSEPLPGLQLLMLPELLGGSRAILQSQLASGCRPAHWQQRSLCGVSLRTVLPVLQDSDPEHSLVCSITDGTEPEGSHHMRRCTTWRGWLLQRRHPLLRRTRGLQEPGQRLQSRHSFHLAAHALDMATLRPHDTCTSLATHEIGQACSMFAALQIACC